MEIGMDKSEMLKDILLKEYDAMRTEIRMYINKYYIAITLIYTILSAGLLKIDPMQSGGLIYIWIPYIISAIIGFMTMITFFVSKITGYIRLLEVRIAKIFGTIPPEIDSSLKEKLLLAPLFWESTYADVSIDRDKGRQFSSPFFISILAMFISGLIALSIIMYFGFEVASKYDILMTHNCGYIYLITSTALLVSAIALFPIVNTYTRRKTTEINNELLSKYQLLEKDESINNNYSTSNNASKPSDDNDDDEDQINDLNA